MEDIHHLPSGLFPDGAFPADPIIFDHYKAPAHSFRGKCILHRHAISLVMSGKKTMYFADKTVHITDQEIHFLSMANCIVSMELDLQLTIESILIFFDNNSLGEFYLKHKARIAALRTAAKVGVEPFLTFKKDGFINSYIASLQFLVSAGTPLSEEMKRVKLEELLLYLLERYPSRLLSFPLSTNKELADLELTKAVETNITNNLSLEELAFMCNLSLSTFKRRFIALYGAPPRQWFMQKRMEMAKDMILLGGQKPSEIYDKFGYETHSSFSQSFKQYFGFAPTELKAKVAKQQQKLND